MRELALKALHYIRRHELLKAGDRVGVAVSGGLDSVALLRLLLELRKELGVVLSVVHFNHQLRGAESDADEAFVAELARAHKLELHRSSADAAAHAVQQHLAVEAAARNLRYGFFRQMLAEGRLTRVATAHTLDDQAETVLLRLVRGAGTRGLAGIYPRLGAGRRSSVVGRQEEPAIVRPVLGIRREELRAYLDTLGQSWREDSSNRDLRFARNRVRHGILPRLARNLNPAVRETLAETAEIARAEEEYWESETARVLPLVWDAAAGRRPDSRLARPERSRRTGATKAGGTLKLPMLRNLPLALQRRIVRAAGESLGLRLEFRQVEEILALAAGNAASAKAALLPGGWAVHRRAKELRLEPAQTNQSGDYEYRFSIPGQVHVQEARTVIEAIAVPMADLPAEYNRERLFDPSRLSKDLTVRNWRPGDRFWPAHTRSPKKIKELLQEQHVTGPERQSWPVVADGDRIVWLRGFPAPAQLRPENAAKEAIMIREKPSE